MTLQILPEIASKVSLPDIGYSIRTWFQRFLGSRASTRESNKNYGLLYSRWALRPRACIGIYPRQPVTVLPGSLSSWWWVVLDGQQRRLAVMLTNMPWLRYDLPASAIRYLRSQSCLMA